MAITPERSEELRQLAKARVQELLSQPQTRDDRPRASYTPSKNSQVQYGPRGGRYTLETTSTGKRYRNYF
jgi:hypothetical protein